MSARYNEVLEQMKLIENGRLENRKYIQQLKDKIDYLEERARYTSVTKEEELKENLLTTVIELGNTVNYPIQLNHVKDNFLTNCKFRIKTVIVEFKSVIQKGNLRKPVISFNKNIIRDDKLNVTYLNIAGPKTPMLDNLSANTRKLFALTREYSSANFFKYC